MRGFDEFVAIIISFNGCEINRELGQIWRISSLYLSTAPTVMLPADDGKGSLAGNAGAAGIIRDPIWRVCRERQHRVVNTQQNCHQLHVCWESGGEKNRLTTRLFKGLSADVLTFELALPGFGCQFWWWNGLLTQSAVLQHCTAQNRTCRAA